MVKEELDKITLDSIQSALEEVGFEVRRMENCVITDEGYELRARTRSLSWCSPSAEANLELFKESMRCGYWDRGVGRIYLYTLGYHVVHNIDCDVAHDYVPVLRYALHFDLGTREGFESGKSEAGT